MIVMCIDMDAFFASVEARDHPEYTGMPIVVGALPKKGKGRGVVSTANYEARKYGIKSGMPISKAYRLCPDAIFFRPDISRYEKESQKIMEIIKAHADAFEQVSIDEAFIDVSKRCKSMEEARALALLIKEKIYEATGLTCSIGIASNKLLAKIASKLKKPDGLSIVEPGKEKEFLKELKPDAIPGIGKKTQEMLKKLGIEKISDLQKKSPFWFTKHFGKIGVYYYYAVNGIDKEKVGLEAETKSIGKEKTFEEDVAEGAVIFEALKMLCKEVWKEVRQEGLYFKCIEVKIRYSNFETHSHEKTFVIPIDSEQFFEENAKAMLAGFLTRPIRLIGVRAKKFVKERQLRLA
jgi:DNA polymerase IV (DinB-like DNA polymerase)